ncbi:glycosyltransferase [Candidatus Dojkabacteria bacterium]|jgi:glycosyltransferase involved in cell wall biosynthesis|nr:glycosyltransferase [Candidatus Dojkabacteria bacterium]
MENCKNILIFTGLSEKKLKEKLLPLLDSSYVNKLYLVRKEPFIFSHPKLVQVNTIKIFRKITLLSEAYRLFAGFFLMLTRKIDILIGIHYLMHCIYAYLLAKLFKRKYIFIFIESPDKYKENKTFVKMTKGATLVGVKGTRSFKYVESLGIHKENLFVLPNQFEIQNLSENTKKKLYDLIYIGNFRDVKDLPLWVEIIYEIKKKMPNISGVMLGDGPRFENIKELINQKGLKDNITLAGRLNDVNKYIDVSRLMLLTSVSEGLPMVVVESMARGVPSITTNVGDVADLMESEKNGLIISSRDPKEFAEEIMKLLNDKKRYEDFSKESIISVKKQIKDYSHENIVSLWNTKLKAF